MEKKYRITFFPMDHDAKVWKNCTKTCLMGGGCLHFCDSEGRSIMISGDWVVEEEKQ